MIDKEGTVKITDFGIAVALSQNSITQTNSILGSVQYISPEQARGNMVTKQSDIYSLGIVLYEMLTGVVPFEGESAVSVALKHFQSPIPSLREFDTRIPQPLENVVLRAAAKDAKDRYGSVSEMQADLETSLDSSRRNEEIFVPADINEEDTLIMKEPLVAAERENLADGQTAVILEPDKKPEKKKKPWWLLIFPILLIAIFLFWSLTRPQEIDLPDELIGSTLEEAIELLQENNLMLGETIQQPNDEVEVGLVFRTSPNPGSTVREGASVDLYVSEGEEPYNLSDYVGLNYEEVRAELTELGFSVESETRNDESIPAGMIIEQDIDPETDVKISETTITFVVSDGRRSIELIDFEGYTRPGVNDYVSMNGLELTVTEESSEDIQAGLVISQSPEAGSTVYAGDTISVIFSTGPEEIELVEFIKEITIPFQEPLIDEDDTDEPDSEITNNEVKIFINDHEKDYDEPAYELTISQDLLYTIRFVIEEGSYATYKVEIDGQLYVEETARP